MRVLYLEDDALDGEALRRALARLRPEVRLAVTQSPTDALDRLRQAWNGPGFDILIVDVSLPEMNGFEFIDRVRTLDRVARPPRTVVFTSSEHRIDLAEAERISADAYVVKTADPRCFDELVRALDGDPEPTSAAAQPPPSNS